MEIPFIGGAYLGRSSNLDPQRCVNLYPEIDKQGGRPIFLSGTPGLSPDISILTSLSSGIFYPNVSGDDGFVTTLGSAWRNDDNWLTVAYNNPNSWSAFIRFANVTIDGGIPAGAFSNTFLKLTCYYTRTPNMTCRIYFNDIDDAVAPTSYAEYQALDKTTNYVEWAITSQWNDGTQYSSPSVVSPLQEVFARSGWESGNAVMAMIEGVSGDTRYISSVDYNSGAEKPELHISYDLANI